MISPQLNSEELSVLASAARTLIWALSQGDEQRQNYALLGCQQLLQRHQLQHRLQDLYQLLIDQDPEQALEELRRFCRPHFFAQATTDGLATILSPAIVEQKAEAQNPESALVEKTDTKEQPIEQPIEPPPVEEELSTEPEIKENIPKDEAEVEADTETEEPTSSEEVIQEEQKPVESPEEIRQFRQKLRNRFSLRERSDFIPSPLSISRRDFWHKLCGGAELSSLYNAEDETVAALQAMGVVCIADLLLQPPKDFQRAVLLPLSSAVPNGSFMVRGRLLGKWLRLSPHIDQWEVYLSCQNDVELRCIWLGHVPRGWDTWKVGDTIGLIGEISVDPAMCMVAPEPVGVNGRGSGLFPIYDFEGIEDRAIRDLVSCALEYILHRIQDPLPKEVLDRYRLLNLDEALRDAHFPANTSYRGRYRICFDEVFFYLVGQRLHAPDRSEIKGISHRIGHEGVARLGMIKNIELNDPQEITFAEIRRDLISPVPMRRLLQGDVGAGKTLIALFSAIMVAQAGHQILYLTADPFTAERRFLFASNLLRTLGISSLLVLEKASHAQLDAIRRGEASFVFASTNVQPWGLPWKSISLAIIEETGNFGALLSLGKNQKNTKCDLLVLTPTPQPMGILETVYSQLDISIIASMRHSVSNTTFHEASQRQKVYEEAMLHLSEGRISIIVLPLKGGKDLLSLDEALKMAGVLGQKLLKGMRIGVYCSEMKRNERLRVFDDFQRRQIDVLFCTTVIEDAPGVGNASIMIVEYADKHDLLRLHRLRGHISKAHYTPICRFVLSDQVESEDRKKIERVCGEYNGFVLAEVDEQLRGLSKITGNPDLIFPNYLWVHSGTHRELRMKARQAAQILSLQDLRQKRWPLLNNAIQQWWGELIGMLPKQQQRRRKRRRRKRSR